MTIYVDKTKCYNDRPHGIKYWCHMMIDAESDLEELHQFAQRIGLRREWFQDKPRVPHYDLALTKRRKAIQRGAVVVDSITMIERCRRTN